MADCSSGALQDPLRVLFPSFCLFPDHARPNVSSGDRVYTNSVIQAFYKVGLSNAHITQEKT